MQNNIKMFKNNELGAVRTLEINDEIWFVAKDVAESLGYQEPQKAIRDHIFEDEKGVTKMDTPGGKQELIIINESGLYNLIFSSKLEKAQIFRKWVTKEVLPSIRRYGMYVTDELISNNELLQDKIHEIKHEKEIIEKGMDGIVQENKKLLEASRACRIISYNTKNDISHLPNIAKELIKSYIENKKYGNNLIEITNKGYILNKRDIYKEISKIVMRRSDIAKLLIMMGVKVDSITVFVDNEILQDDYSYYGFSLCQ